MASRRIDNRHLTCRGMNENLWTNYANRGIVFGEPGQALGVMRLGELRLNPQRFVELDNRFRWILIAKQLDSAQVVRFGGTLRPGNPDAEQKEKNPAHGHQMTLALTCPIRGCLADVTVPKRLLAKFPLGLLNCA